MLVVLLYGPSTGYGYSDWDDTVLVRDNPLLQRPTLSAAIEFFRVEPRRGEALYIPLAYVFWMVERAVFGNDPGVLHGISVLLHALNGILVYLLLLHLVRSRSAALLGAAAFVVHPLQVETVAWIMGQRDLLAVALALASVLAYVRYRGNDRRRWYVIALIAYALALLFKPVVAPVPALLVLLDYRRVGSWRRCGWPALAPFLAVAVLAGLANAATGGPGYGQAPATPYRLLCLPWLVWHWGIHALLLSEPVPFHAWPLRGADGVGPVLARGLPGLAAFLALGLLAWRRSWSGAWQVLLALAIAFSPAVLAVLDGTRSFVTADRYGYLALVPGFALLAAGWRSGGDRRWTIARIVLLAWVLGAAVVSFGAVKTWSGPIALWTRVLEVHPDELQALVNRGSAFSRAGRHPEAWRDYERALERHPEERLLLRNVGRMFLDWQRPKEAIRYYRRYLALGPGDVEVYLALGDAETRLGRFVSAVRWYQRAARAAPSDHRGEAAVTDATLLECRRRLRVDENDVDAMVTAARMHIRRGEREAAVAMLRRAIRHDSPLRAEALYLLGRIFLERGSPDAGRRYLKRALDVDPSHRGARRLLDR